MKYTEFVKANYHKVAHLPHKERFKHLGAMWKKEKGAGLFSDIGHKVSDVAGMFGLGLDMPKKRGRKAKGGLLTAGALDGAGLGGGGSVVSAGALPRRRKAKGGSLGGGGSVVSAGGLKDVHGAGFLSGILGTLGL